MGALDAFTLTGLPEVARGDDLAALIAAAAPSLADTDIVVIAHKVVSKAQGRTRRLAEIDPSDRARELAAEHAKDPRLVQAILDEAAELLRAERGVLIVRTHHGFVCANAGVDASNVEPGFVTVLPRDPDASAERLRIALSQACACPVATIVSDTFGRPWRDGVVNVALGVAGLRPLLDYRGGADSYGRPLQSTVVALADELASAAELVTRKTARLPVAIVRGAADWAGEGSGRMLLREPGRDLFR
jgi:coenzyme F420-0:L-glutamate ligase/coenzyme F420-1:gamma-L-glutamate ligase